MITFPNAKINLGLEIIGKRMDGFHDIETVFYPINLCDALEIVKSSNDVTSFNSTGIEIPGDDENNLCLKAFSLLKTDFDLPSVNIHLHKVIPIGAGLGGGSSDAAHALFLLNELFNLKLKQGQLLNYASSLGTDCVFFILNKAAFAYEKGDKFQEVNLSLKGYQLVLVKPNIHVSTAEAYAGVNIKKEKLALINRIKQPISKWRNTLKNNFEETIFKKYPEIEHIKKTLYENGASYASMSGSGSAVYALFENELDLSHVFKNYFYFSIKI